MARTFLNLQDEVLLDEFDATKYRSLVKTWLNEAAQHVSREVQLPQLETELVFTQAAGSPVVTVPTGMQVLTSIRQTLTGRKLMEVSIDDVDAWATQVGVPSSYALYGASIILSPTPAASVQLSMRYEGGLPDLSSSDDTQPLGFPEDFMDVLVFYARMRAFAMEDDIEMSTFHRGLWEAGLSRMRSQMQLRSRGRTRQVPGMLRQGSRPRFNRP